jgi:RND family efflux transporter MFP subunit
VTVVARVKGYLEERFFEEGRDVEEGEALFLIEPAPYEAAVLGAQAQAFAAEVALNYARIEYERNEPLVQTGAISKQAWDKDVANLESGLAQLELAQASLIQAQINLGYTEVRAPFAGRIGRRYVDVGNLVGPGTSQDLALIVKLDPMRVVFEPAGTELIAYLNAWPKTQAPVSISFQSTGGPETFAGTLDLVDNTLNSGTSTFLARAEFDNPDGVVLPGLFARVGVTIGTIKGAIVVPPEAVFAELESSYVWTVTKENTLDRTNVTLGRLYKGVQIVNGIDAGTTVLVAGNPYLVKQGAKLDPTLLSIDAFAKQQRDAESAADAVGSAPSTNTDTTDTTDTTTSTN